MNQSSFSTRPDSRWVAALVAVIAAGSVGFVARPASDSPLAPSFATDQATPASSVLPPRDSPDGASVTSAPGWADCEPDGFSTECLTDTMEAIVGTDGPDAALASWTDAEVAYPQLFGQCHTYYHVAGQEAGRRASSLRDVLGVASLDCNFGYVHGVIEGFLEATSDEKLSEVFPTLCTDLSEAGALFGNCGHGAGHEVLTRSEGHVADAIELCRYLGGTGIAYACVDGVFMAYGQMVFQAKGTPAGDAAPFDEASVLGVCATVTPQDAPTCFSYAGTTWPSYLTTSEAMLVRCAEVAGDLIGDCADGVGRGLAFRWVTEPDRAIAECQVGPVEGRASCVRGVASTVTFNRASGQAKPGPDICTLVSADQVELCEVGAAEGDWQVSGAEGATDAPTDAEGAPRP